MDILDFDRAVDSLRKGKLIVYPTETFYAVGCDALQPDAVRAVYSVKLRNNSYPLPVILGDIKQLNLVAREVCHTAQALIEQFWPGPLSIIFPAAVGLPSFLHGSTDRVAARLSAHPAARELALAAGTILSASSANISGFAPASRLEDIDPVLLCGIDGGVYDLAPQPSGGLPSTVLEPLPDSSGYKIVKILRAGVISSAELACAGFVCCE